jgi:hypothetical protein
VRKINVEFYGRKERFLMLAENVQITTATQFIINETIYLRQKL